MKQWLVVFIVAISAVAWWNLRDFGDEEGASGELSSIIAVPADDTADSATKTSDVSELAVTKPTNEKDADKLDKESAVSSADTVPESDSVEAENTPFAVVDDELQAREPTVQDEQASQTPVTNKNAVLPRQGGQSTQRSAVPVNVPDSYPVTEAGKYFIPKEEREPGRLGGPPPLNFPGGPSDPSRQSDQVLQPPVAPGQ